MMKGILRVVALVGLCGCGTWSDAYLIGVRTGNSGEQLEPSHFYRISLDGQSFLLSTRFQSGWLDRDAVDQLFSDVVGKVAKLNRESVSDSGPDHSSKRRNDADAPQKDTHSAGDKGTEDSSGVAPAAGDQRTSTAGAEPVRDGETPASAAAPDLDETSTDESGEHSDPSREQPVPGAGPTATGGDAPLNDHGGEASGNSAGGLKEAQKAPGRHAPERRRKGPQALSRERDRAKAFLVFGPQGQTIDPTDRRLVIFAVSNPRALVNAVNQFVDQGTLANALKSVLLRDHVRTRDAARLANALDADEHASIRRTLERVKESLSREDLGHPTTDGATSDGRQRTARLRDLATRILSRLSIPPETEVDR